MFVEIKKKEEARVETLGTLSDDNAKVLTNNCGFLLSVQDRYN